MNYYDYDLNGVSKYYNPTSLAAVKADLLATPGIDRQLKSVQILHTF